MLYSKKMNFSIFPSLAIFPSPNTPSKHLSTTMFLTMKIQISAISSFQIILLVPNIFLLPHLEHKLLPLQIALLYSHPSLLSHQITITTLTLTTMTFWIYLMQILEHPNHLNSQLSQTYTIRDLGPVKRF